MIWDAVGCCGDEFIVELQSLFAPLSIHHVCSILCEGSSHSRLPYRQAFPNSISNCAEAHPSCLALMRIHGRPILCAFQRRQTLKRACPPVVAVACVSVYKCVPDCLCGVAQTRRTLAVLKCRFALWRLPGSTARLNKTDGNVFVLCHDDGNRTDSPNMLVRWIYQSKLTTDVIVSVVTYPG